MKKKLLTSKKETSKSRLPESRPLFKKLLYTLFFVLVASSVSFAQTRYFALPPTAPTTSNNYKGPNGGIAFQRTAMIYPATETSGLPLSPTTLNSVGFNITTPAGSAATGNIKVYMSNTTDATYTKGTTWSTIITGMTLVYDGPLTIPAAIGFYDITLQTPFTFTGGGVYVAFDWTATTPSATPFPVYAANSSLAASAVTGAGTVVQPTLTTPGPSAFRPQIRLGFTPPANDLKVHAVYTLGKLPILPATNPHVVKAAVVNFGANAQTNKTVTLTVAGATTFTTTATIANLPAGDTAIVTFPGYTATTTGTNTLTVTVPSDDNNTNNSATYTQLVTADRLSYAEGNPPVHTTGLRPLAPNGTLLARFTVGSQAVTVPTVGLFISFDPNNVGQTVYAVVQDASGNQVGRSADYVIQTADLSSIVNFTITNPPVLVNTDFYAGLALVTSTTTFFPMGVQPETPARANTFYTGPLAGGSQPGLLGSPYRLIIEPVLAPFNGTDAVLSAITTPVNACALTATEQVCISISNAGSAPLTNIPVAYNINNGTPVIETVPGPIAAGATLNYCFTTTANLSGTGPFTVNAGVNVPGDIDLTNNTKTVTVNSVQVGAVTIPNVSRCGPGPVTLNPTATNGEIFVYYDAATGGNEIGSRGTAFTTGNITTNTTYYVQGFRATPAGKVGPASNVIGAGGYGNFTNHTVFDALVPLRLDSVKLFSDGALTATIGIFDTLTGNPIDSVLVTIPGAGAHTVFLGLNVPAGNGYGLRVFTYNSGTGQLFRNTAGATFPYVLPGVIRVTGNSFTPVVSNSTRYYYFFDISVSERTCPSARVPVQITINPLPTITVGANQSVCADAAPITLPAATPAGGTWSGNGVTSAGVFTPSTALVGNQTLTYTYTDATTTCSNSAVLTVTVNALPTVNAGAAQSVCENASPITLAGATPTGGTWTGSGVSTTGVFTPSSSLIGAQTLTYTFTNTTTGCTNTATKVVTVNAAPATPTISQLTNDTLAASVVGSSYAWTFNGTPLAGVTTRTFKATADGTYTVTVTNASGCTSASSAGFAFTVTGMLGSLNRNLSMFPNPTNGMVKISLDKVNAKTVQMTVKNVTGQTIISRSIETQNHLAETNLDLSGHAKGIYYLELRDGSNIANHKIVLQ